MIRLARKIKSRGVIKRRHKTSNLRPEEGEPGLTGKTLPGRGTAGAKAPRLGGGVPGGPQSEGRGRR